MYIRQYHRTLPIMRVPLRVWLLALLGSLLCVEHARATLTCTLNTGNVPSNFNMNPEAYNGIQYDLGQNSFNFMALDCSCQPRTDLVLINTQTSTGVLDTMSNLQIAGQNWRNASVFRLRDCAAVTMNLNQGVGELATEMQGAAFIFLNIDNMQLQGFAAGGRGTGPYYDQQTFTSIAFINVGFAQTSGTLQFGEKKEILMNNVSLSSIANGAQYISVNVLNQVNNRYPVFRLFNSSFSSPTDPNQANAQGSAKFSIKVTNQQYAYDTTQPSNEGCYQDYQGAVEMRQNSFGSLPQDTIEVDGANRFDFEQNYVAYASANAFILYNIKNTIIQSNVFSNVIAEPIVSSTYVAKTGLNDCNQNTQNTNIDLPETAIQTLSFSSNNLPSFSGVPIAINRDQSYSQNFVQNKLQAAGNIAMTPCNCTFNYSIPINPNSQGSSGNTYLADQYAASNVFVATMQCTAVNQGEIVVGSRTSVCAGQLPPTMAQRIQDAQTMTRKRWAGWVALAACVTFLVTAIVVGLIVWKCCTRSEVNP